MSISEPVKNSGFIELSQIEDSLGTDGATAPVIPGTGVRGWLRSIYDRLSGTISVSSSLPSGAATANKQDTGNTSLASIDTNLGAKADLTASTDSGTFSLIALFKRLLEKITNIISVKITDGGGAVNTKQLGLQLTTVDVGLITNTIVHGVTTGGGGGYVDVKVTPSGALTVEAEITSSALPIGASTSALQITSNNLLTSIDSGIIYKNSINIDAGGRLRSSLITTLGDYKCLNADEVLLLENTGTGTGSYSLNKYNMSVTSGQYLIRRSKSYHHYFSGKSQLVELTFDNFHIQSNLLKRSGYFSSNAVAPYDTDKDGFFLENTGVTIDLVVLRKGVETLRKNITEWDGYSSLSTYNWQNFTVILFDYLWLGGAILRMFVKTSSGFILAHTFNYSGTSQDVMMLSSNHSIRYEIRSTTGTGSFRFICAQVSTEGSINESGKQKSINTGTADISCAAIGTTYCIKSIRKKTTHRDSPVKIIGAQLFVSSNFDRGLMEVLLNPTLSGALTYSDVTNSSVQEATGDGIITVTNKGTVIFSMYITQNTVTDSDVFVSDFLTWLCESISDISDVIAISLTPLTATVVTNGVINYKDY